MITLQQFLDRLTPVTTSDKLFFVQYLAMMLKAGMSLAPALTSIAAQTKNHRFQMILANIKGMIEQGSTFSLALEKHEKIFGSLFINMIKIGEVSGTLERVLQELYLQMKKEHEMSGKIKGALVYPIIVVVAMIGIGTAVMVFIVPKLTAMFTEFDATLPVATRILMTTSDFLVNHGLLVALGVIALASTCIYAIRQPRGKRLWHTILLKLPIIGPIIIKINIARLTRTLGTLLATNIPITNALTITASIVGNVHYREFLTQSANEVKRGIALGSIFPKAPKLLPPTLIQMVIVGEETGSLDVMLKEISTFYESEVAQIMDALPSIIEPLLMLLLGLGVGGLAIAIVMPMYSLSQQI